MYYIIKSLAAPRLLLCCLRSLALFAAPRFLTGGLWYSVSNVLNIEVGNFKPFPPRWEARGSGLFYRCQPSCLHPSLLIESAINPAIPVFSSNLVYVCLFLSTTRMS